MNEVLSIVIKCVGVIALAVVTYVVVPAIKEWRSNKLTASQQEQLTFWVETGVLWAKQWLQSETGEQKKAQVMDWVRFKVNELGLHFSDEDIDKCIEAIYNTVKDVVDVTVGNQSFNQGE